MNYNTFLNNNYKFKNKNRYRLRHKKKNIGIFLFSSIISVAVLASSVTLLTDSDPRIKTQQLTLKSETNSTTHRIKQSPQPDLPEVGYHSEILSKAIIFSEPETKQLSANITENVSSIAITEQISVKATDSSNLQESNSQQKNIETNPDKTVKTTFIDKTVLDKKGTSSTNNTISNVIDKKQSAVLSPVNSEESQTHIKTIVVKKGDTLSEIFNRLSLSSNTLYKIINSGEQTKKLTRIKPGQMIAISLNESNEFKSLHYAIDKVDSLIVKKEHDTYSAHIKSKEIDVRQQFASGIIDNSLFATGNKAGLSDSMIMKLAHLFGWDIDFALDIRKGDSFSILFEEKYIDNNKFSDGNILSAEFVNKGKTFKAIRYTDSSGHTDYYSEKGLSMRKAFLRTPVDFSRISSRFNLKRKHPILNKVRAHKGVDYAAARGTPIKAVGDGKVTFKGRKGGYGRVIVLQHGSKYSTLYGHMNSYNKKIKQGNRVKQGQIIGYVGSSGMATGPHLHYEFRLNGVHRNPLTIALPSAAPIARKYRTDFYRTAKTMLSQLTLRKQEVVALKEN